MHAFAHMLILTIARVCVCVHKYVCVRAFANHSLIFLLLLAIFTDHLINICLNSLYMHVHAYFLTHVHT